MFSTKRTSVTLSVKSEKIQSFRQHKWVVQQTRFDKPCYPETIRHVLRNQYFNRKIERKKPLISTNNQQTRLKLAKQHLNLDTNFYHVMLWVCMSAAGVRKMHLIESTMDTPKYLGVLKANLLENVQIVEIRDSTRTMPQNISRICDASHHKITRH